MTDKCMQPENLEDEAEHGQRRPDFCMRRGELVRQQWLKKWLGRHDALRRMHQAGLVKLSVGKEIYYRTDDVIDVLYESFRKE